METLGGLPLLTEGVTCPSLLDFDIISRTVDLGMPVIFEISTCENFCFCNRTPISRAKMGVGLPIVLPTLTRNFSQMMAKQEDKLRESMFHVKKRGTQLRKVNKNLPNAKRV